MTEDVIMCAKMHKCTHVHVISDVRRSTNNYVSATMIENDNRFMCEFVSKIKNMCENKGMTLTGYSLKYSSRTTIKDEPAIVDLDWYQVMVMAPAKTLISTEVRIESTHLIRHLCKSLEQNKITPWYVIKDRDTYVNMFQRMSPYVNPYMCWDCSMAMSQALAPFVHVVLASNPAMIKSTRLVRFGIKPKHLIVYATMAQAQYLTLDWIKYLDKSRIMTRT